jgi:uncharacterized alkaline shock family protein YloU
MTTVTAPSGVDTLRAGTNPVPAERQVGSTRIASKALSGLVRAVAGEALGVRASAVSVNLSDLDGKLAIEVAGPVAVDLANSLASGPSVIEAATTAQSRIAEQTTALSGSLVGRVRVRVTGCEFINNRRVL